MIGSLHGIVELFDGVRIFVNVNGIGYRVHVPQQILATYKVSQPIDLFVYSHIREDVFDLYGFPNLEELKLFEAFLDVSGIGPKTALSIFSIGNREQIITAIQKADVGFFTAVPRLGKKNAQKLIIELKGKLGSLEELDLSGTHAKEENEVLLALKSFGFSQREAEEALKATSNVAAAVGNGVSDVSSRLKMALKYLGK